MNNHHDAYNALIERHDALILGECVDAIQRHPDLRLDTEDLVQEVHIGLHERIDKIAKRARNERAFVRECIRQLIRHAIKEASDAEEPINLVE